MGYVVTHRVDYPMPNDEILLGAHMTKSLDPDC